MDKSSKVTREIGALGLFVRGLAMGAADVVPGVSGGTIAFITGIYRQFIDALKSLSLDPLKALSRGRPRAFIASMKAFHWHTLIPLGLGVALAVLSLSKVVTSCMDNYPAATYALFFGLILCSVIAPYLQIDSKSPLVVITFLAATLLAWSFVGLHPASPPKDIIRSDANATYMVYAGKLRTSADVDALVRLRNQTNSDLQLVFFDPKGVLSDTITPTPKRAISIGSKSELKQWLDSETEARRLVVAKDQSPNLLWIFFSGFIAISAMVLPGLSGSFLLLFLGLYHVIFGALHGTIGALLALLGRSPGPLMALSGANGLGDVSIVLSFGFGVLLGLGVFSRVVSWLFRRAKNHTLAALTGLMVGALRLPGTRVLDGTNQLTENLTLPIVCLLMGMGIVIGLLLVDRKRAADPSS